MTEREAELAVMGALQACGPAEGCGGCPLYAEANDASCALYLMALARDPGGYEMRAGRVEPRGER